MNKNLSRFINLILISSLTNFCYSHSYNSYDYNYNLPDNPELDFSDNNNSEYADPNCAEVNNLVDAMANGQVKLFFRLRYESYADKSPQFKTGMLTSLRSQIRYNTAKFIDSQFFFEVTNVANILYGRYNSGFDGIGKSGFAPIPDLQGTGITEAYLKYTGFPCSSIHYGRQKIRLNNERHVGWEDFRQYPKNFDALLIKTNSILPEINLLYGFLYRMNTNTAAHCSLEKNKLRTHLLNACWQFMCDQSVSGFTYLNRDKTESLNSNSTYGVRMTGKWTLNPSSDFYYATEYAYQNGGFNNPVKYNAYYLMGEIGLKHKLFNPTIGVEILSGDNTQSNARFQTPLGSNHEFQGWYDFTIPDRGVRDWYAKTNTSMYCYCITAAYHSFHYQSGDNNSFANEIDIKISRELEPGIDFGIAYSKFNAKRDFTSGSKFWLSLSAAFG